MSARNHVANILSRLRSVFGGADQASKERSESGAALVEFTVLMPLFFLVLFGIVEFGSILFLQNNMTNAAREGARTSSVQGGSMQAAARAACQWLVGAGQTFTITATDLCPGSQDVRVDITIPASSASLMNSFFSFSGGTLSVGAWGGTFASSVTMRKELSCSVAAGSYSCSCNTQGGGAGGC